MLLSLNFHICSCTHAIPIRPDLELPKSESSRYLDIQIKFSQITELTYAGLVFGVEVKKLDGEAPFLEGAVAAAVALGLVGGGGGAEALTGLRPRTSEGLSEAGNWTSLLA